MYAQSLRSRLDQTWYVVVYPRQPEGIQFARSHQKELLLLYFDMVVKRFGECLGKSESSELKIDR